MSLTIAATSALMAISIAIEGDRPSPLSRIPLLQCISAGEVFLGVGGLFVRVNPGFMFFFHNFLFDKKYKLG
jgi:hypothetical protein